MLTASLECGGLVTMQQALGSGSQEAECATPQDNPAAFVSLGDECLVNPSGLFSVVLAPLCQQRSHVSPVVSRMKMNEGPEFLSQRKRNLIISV